MALDGSGAGEFSFLDLVTWYALDHMYRLYANYCSP